MGLQIKKTLEKKAQNTATKKLNKKRKRVMIFD